MVTKDDVKRFWESEPLFTGEANSKDIGRDFFEEHERVYIRDCFAGSIEDFYFSNLGGNKVLDVGCGPGFWVRQFCKRGFDTYGVDLTETAVRIANQSLDVFGYKANVTTGDAENLPFEDSSFDHVNSFGVIHHTPNTQKCIQEFHRVLKPGGTVCVSVYHKNFLLSHTSMLKLISVPLRILMSGLKGRGREDMMSKFKDAGDLVRLYDGENNPLGKCYSYREFDEMMSPYFDIDHKQKTFFPLRALKIPVPLFIHKRILHKHFGLLIVYKGRKKA